MTLAVGQHCTDNGSMWEPLIQQTGHIGAVLVQRWSNASNAATTLYQHNKSLNTHVGSMLAHRLRRSPNIEPTLGDIFVFVVCLLRRIMFG